MLIKDLLHILFVSIFHLQERCSCKTNDSQRAASFVRNSCTWEDRCACACAAWRRRTSAGWTNDNGGSVTSWVDGSNTGAARKSCAGRGRGGVGRDLERATIVGVDSSVVGARGVTSIGRGLVTYPSVRDVNQAGLGKKQTWGKSLHTHRRNASKTVESIS